MKDGKLKLSAAIALSAKPHAGLNTGPHCQIFYGRQFSTYHNTRQYNSCESQLSIVISFHHNLSIGKPSYCSSFFPPAIPELSAKMMHPSRQAFVEDHPMDEVSRHQIAAFQWSLPFAQNNTTARGSTDWCACTQDRGGLTLDQVREYLVPPSL